MVPSPPNTISRSTRRASEGTSGQVGTSRPANGAVWASASTSRPLARMSRTACCTPMWGLDNFSGLAISPSDLNSLTGFFNQDQKFLVVGGTQEGGLRHSPPAHAHLGAYKFAHLPQYAGVDLGLGDDPRAAVGLRFAGLELGLDQC